MRATPIPIPALAPMLSSDVLAACVAVGVATAGNDVLAADIVLEGLMSDAVDVVIARVEVSAGVNVAVLTK